MWAIRVLNGPQTGEIFPLKNGKLKIGRSQKVDIRLNSDGVSKEHLEIAVVGNKVFLTDLNSSNGTFLNGTRIKGGVLKLGDKVGVHDIILDVVSLNEKPEPVFIHDLEDPAPVPPLSISEKLNQFVEEKIMPGFYQMTEQFDFKFVLGGFVLTYIITITLVILLAMKQITSDGLSVEGHRQALAAARSLARGNEKTPRHGEDTHFSLDYAIRKDNIDDVYVVSKEGRILAPRERAGSFPKEFEFVRKSILQSGFHDVSAEIGEKKIAAAVPIFDYDPELQRNVANAYGVVIYNQNSLQIDDKIFLNLFIKTLLLALAAGGVLFLFLYNLVEYPFQLLLRELDSALRDKKWFMAIRVQMPALQKLLIIINSLLSRAAHSEFSQVTTSAGIGSKNQEYMNILQLIGRPALLVAPNGLILKGNTAFSGMTGMALEFIENQYVAYMPDQGMKKHFMELMKTAADVIPQPAKGNLEIGRVRFITTCQVATTSTGEVDGYFIALSPKESIEGQVA